MPELVQNAPVPTPVEAVSEDVVSDAPGESIENVAEKIVVGTTIAE
ncbi:hypothetical protein ACN08Z_03945 [Rothia sp. P7181]